MNDNTEQQPSESAITFLRNKGILSEFRTQWIVKYPDGKEFDLVNLLEEYKVLQPTSESVPEQTSASKPCSYCGGSGFALGYEDCHCKGTGEESGKPTSDTGSLTKEDKQRILQYKFEKWGIDHENAEFRCGFMIGAEYEHRYMAAKQAELIAWLQNKVNECQQDHDHHMAHGCSIERINQITGARNAYQRALEFVLTTTPKP